MLSLAACHHSPLPANITLQLKEGKLPDQCFSYSPVSRLHGESRSSPCQELELFGGLEKGPGLLDGAGDGATTFPASLLRVPESLLKNFLDFQPNLRA